MEIALAVCHSSFRNPTSAFDAAAPRRALTLVEVLVAMGIMTLGLLGVAALFPVGGVYMQSGDVADQSGALAQAALDDAIVRGYLNPESWAVHDVTAGARTPPRPAPLPWFVPLRTLSTEVAAGRSNNIISGLPTAPPTASTYLADIARHRATMLGAAYVIDPLGVASALKSTNAAGAWANTSYVQPQLSTSVRNFPPGQATFTYSALSTNGPSWAPWHSNGAFWPVRRVWPAMTYASGGLPETQPTSGSLAFYNREAVAEQLLRGASDLAVSLPEDASLPGRSAWDTWTVTPALPGGPRASVRQRRGDYSWIITVTPESSEARDALATRPDAYQYSVSSVVFHKRTLGDGPQAIADAERLVRARVVSTGTSGGEILLDRFAPTALAPATGINEPSESPFENLKANEFVMLCGPHPASTNERPMLFLQWYRVTGIEDTGAPALAGLTSDADRRLNRDSANARVLVSLRGPDWPWQPTSDLSSGGLLANDLRVAIIPGAVAVHTKTMRLESGSAWSGE
ncbi:MAG: type IV pilus modification PilV family protein [Lacipirellulaceae bacterium]